MSAAKENPYTFSSCFVQDKQTFRVLSQHDILVQAGSTLSNVMTWDGEDKTWSYYDLEWQTNRVVMAMEPKKTIFALGPLGICSVVDADKAAAEHLDSSPEGPSGRGPLRDLRLIGGQPFATGMGRQFYHRAGPNQWIHEDFGVVQPLGELQVSGFNSIDGGSVDDIFAVGFGGEIWRRIQKAWNPISSPTANILHRVKYLSTDLQYACGQQGTLLKGHGDHWEVLVQNQKLGDFWDMEWFLDQLYIAGDKGLFRLSADGSILKIDIGVPGSTFQFLHSADRILLSSGPKTVAYTEDGRVWQDITP